MGCILVLRLEAVTELCQAACGGRVILKLFGIQVQGVNRVIFGHQKAHCSAFWLSVS